MPTIEAAITKRTTNAVVKKELAAFHNTGKWTNVAIGDAYQRGYDEGRAQYRASIRKEIAAVCAEIWDAHAESAARHDE